MLMSLVEHYHYLKHPLFVSFIDLKGAYDTVQRSQLFHVLLHHTGIDTAITKQLLNLYTHVATQVCVHGQLSGQFTIGRGVK